MGVNKSITIEGATFRFEVKSKDGGYARYSLFGRG